MRAREKNMIAYKTIIFKW